MENPSKRKIHLLAPSIAERIAAGEVIERPASVVKELVENSLDAHSTEIIVNLEDGGKSLIEIIDNGEGMLPEDLELSIERHATSKLDTLDDLDRIRTLGFRGEALASVSAVADLTLISRTKDSSSAYELTVGDLTHRYHQQPKAKKVTFGNFVDSPHGTLIRARGLFSQIPARLKFLKTQGAEVSQVRDWIERLALAYPHVGFQLISDDRTLLNLRPQSEEDRVKAVLSDGDDYPLISANNEQDGFRDVGLQVRVHWLQGLSSPNSRRLNQIVNSRAVRDRMLQQAILSPFRQALLPGQFPAVALFIQINPAVLDVNVHPTKTEIRFLDSSKIFRTVDHLVKSMISRAGAPAFATMQMQNQAFTSSDTPLEISPHPFQSGESAKSEFKEASANSSPHSSHSGSYYPNRPTTPWKAAEIFEQTPLMGSNLFPSPTAAEATRPLTSPFPFANDARHVGVLFNTYLIYETPSELILIDQHAAHERIRYERLKKRILGSPESSVPLLSSQSLLIPEVTRFPPEERGTLEQRMNWIEKMGFEAEIFGEDTLVFRGVPAEWGTKHLKPRLKNLIDRLLHVETTESNVILDEALFEALASEACHSAVRAGDMLYEEEQKELVTQLFNCEHPWNCPHGRPTVVKVPEGKIEEWFMRKV